MVTQFDTTVTHSIPKQKKEPAKPLQTPQLNRYKSEDNCFDDNWLCDD